MKKDRENLEQVGRNYNVKGKMRDKNIKITIKYIRE
jgi:hypothetical protein